MGLRKKTNGAVKIKKNIVNGRKIASIIIADKHLATGSVIASL